MSDFLVAKLRWNHRGPRISIEDLSRIIGNDAVLIEEVADPEFCDKSDFSQYIKFLLTDHARDLNKRIDDLTELVKDQNRFMGVSPRRDRDTSVAQGQVNHLLGMIVDLQVRVKELEEAVTRGSRTREDKVRELEDEISGLGAEESCRLFVRYLANVEGRLKALEGAK